MKNVMIIALATLISASAFAAKAPRLYTIDMTGKRFGDQGFNLMDDGISDVDGFQIKLEGKQHRDFEITVTNSERHDENCSIAAVRTSGKFSLVQIDASVETDSGETCDYKITYQDGRTAILNVEETGT